jgi:hypothetical protein
VIFDGWNTTNHVNSLFVEIVEYCRNVVDDGVAKRAVFPPAVKLIPGYVFAANVPLILKYFGVPTEVKVEVNHPPSGAQPITLLLSLTSCPAAPDIVIVLVFNVSNQATRPWAYGAVDAPVDKSRVLFVVVRTAGFNRYG